MVSVTQQFTMAEDEDRPVITQAARDVSMEPAEPLEPQPSEKPFREGGDEAAGKSKAEEDGRRDRGDRDRDRGRDDRGDRGRGRDEVSRKDDRKDDRKGRSRSRDRKRRSRSRDRKTSRRSRSDSRDRRRRRSRSRSRDRDRKKTSSRRSRSRSRDKKRSRSRDRKERRSSRRSHSSDSDEIKVGGYEPRKPREPPPNGPGTGSDPFASFRQAVVPNDPQAQLKMWQLQQLEARAMVLEQQAKSAATATSKTQREVYVGGLIPGAITGEALRTLFNSALAVQFAGYLMPGMDPVINVNLHPEGKYAFVEFRAPEMATAALSLSGQVQLLGCNLSVARPSGYVDPSKAMNASQAATAALAAFKKGDMQALAAAALAGANLKGLGLPPHIEDPATAAMPVLPPGVAIDGLSGTPTTCLCFTGMVTAERLKDDQEYNDMKEDLNEQFAASGTEGTLEDLKIPRPYDPALADQYIGIANYGKIFTKFSTPEAASTCRDKIHGRLYDGKQVHVFFITEEAYAVV